MLSTICAVACLIVPSATARRPYAGQGLTVNLDASAVSYVVGQPLELQVTVSNFSAISYLASEPQAQDREPEIQVHVSADGQRFEQWQLGIYTTASTERQLHVLTPNDRWKFGMRMLFAEKRPDGLKLPDKGVYWVKVVFPLFEVGNFGGRSNRTDIGSNVIKVSVKEPTGADSKVWDRIRGADFAYFLQSGYVRESDAKTLKTAMTVAESVPVTAYHASIRDALRKYYVRNMYGLKRRDADRLRAILNLQAGHLFPEDSRLGVRLLSEFPEDIPLATIIQTMSEMSKVPLHVDPELGKERQSVSKTQAALRDQMSNVVPPGASWKRVGDGYFLGKDVDDRYRLDGKSRDELALFNLSLEVGAHAIDHKNELPTRWEELKPLTIRLEDLERATGFVLRERYGFVSGHPRMQWPDDSGTVVVMTREAIKDRPNESEGRHAIYRTDVGAIRFRWMTEKEVHELFDDKLQFTD